MPCLLQGGWEVISKLQNSLLVAEIRTAGEVRRLGFRTRFTETGGQSSVQGGSAPPFFFPRSSLASSRGLPLWSGSCSLASCDPCSLLLLSVRIFMISVRSCCPPPALTCLHGTSCAFPPSRPSDVLPLSLLLAPGCVGVCVRESHGPRAERLCQEETLSTLMHVSLCPRPYVI